MSVIDEKAIDRQAKPASMRVNHFIRGKLVAGDAVRHTSRDLGIDFTTPAIDLDALITPRSQMPPLYQTKLADIIDFLVEAGRAARSRAQPLPSRIARVRRGDQPAAATDHREFVSARASRLHSRGADGEPERQFS